MVDPLILNLTGRPCMVNDIEIEPQPNAARCNVTNEILEEISIDGFKAHLSRRIFGDVFGLPEPESGVYYLVNPDISTALPSRKDLLVLGKPSRGNTHDNRRCETLEVRHSNVLLEKSREALKALEADAESEAAKLKRRRKSSGKLPPKRQGSKSKRAK